MNKTILVIKNSDGSETKIENVTVKNVSVNVHEDGQISVAKLTGRDTGEEIYKGYNVSAAKRAIDRITEEQHG